MITIITHLWGSKYSYRNVNALYRMLQEHLTIDHVLVCVTDKPQNIECETYEINEPTPLWADNAIPEFPVTVKRRPNNWRKLWTLSSEFQEQMGSDIIASIDLDVLIRNNVDHLFTLDRGVDFKIVKGSIDKTRTRQLCPYNSSLWINRRGTRDYLFTDFIPEQSPRELPREWTGSDQAWIAFRSPDEVLFDDSDGIRQYWSGHRAGNMLFFAGTVKPLMDRCDPNIRKEYLKYYE